MIGFQTVGSALLASAMATAGTAHSPVQNAKPNLLFIITDDQRFDMMGCVNPVLLTPNMDRLAAQGVRFENAFVTTPICAASRASFLTGMVERSHQYTFGTPPLADKFIEQSYPALLRRAGYHTGHIGKFGVNAGPGGTEALFDTFIRGVAPYMKKQPDGSLRHLTDQNADRAIDYLRAQKDGPFALTLSFNAPHADDGNEDQFIFPPSTAELYKELDLPKPPLSDSAFYDALPEFMKDSSLNRIRWHWRFDTEEKRVRMTKGHYRMISGVDAAIGRVMDELKTLNLDDNTVIVMMGDNGYFLGERGYAGKWTPHELSIRVPLIVFDPRANGGSVPTEPVLNIDIAPTLLDMAGIEVPSTMQGRSLAPLLAGHSPADWRTEFFVEHLFDHGSIPKHEGMRGERFKYARYFEQDPIYEELYDHRADPMETENLALDPVFGAILKRMRKLTDVHRDQYGGPYRKPG
jgi:arylsulfatase A-like enzyme